MPSEPVTVIPDAVAPAPRAGGLTPQETEWRQRIRAFAETRIRPLSHAMDSAATLDPRLRRELFEAGLMAVEIPQMYGGQGRGLFELVLTIEEISRVDPGVAVGVDVHNALVAASVLRLGSGDQKRRYLPLLARSKVGAFALSEEQAGSDAFNLSTVAVEKGSDIFVNGTKRWTSNAAQADVFLVFATDQEGRAPSAFLVDRDTEGLEVGQATDQMGVRAAATAELRLNDVRVRREHCLGGLRNGRAVAVAALDIGRIGIAAQLVGLAQGALDEAVAYSRGRKQFGRRIADFQGVQFTLGAMAADVAAARALLYDATRTIAADAEPDERLHSAALAKYVASQTAERVASQAVEVHGGNGFTKEYPVERLYRDAKVGRIYEGTSNVLLHAIAADLLRDGTANTPTREAR